MVLCFQYCIKVKQYLAQSCSVTFTPRALAVFCLETCRTTLLLLLLLVVQSCDTTLCLKKMHQL